MVGKMSKISVCLSPLGNKDTEKKIFFPDFSFSVLSVYSVANPLKRNAMQI